MDDGVSATDLLGNDAGTDNYAMGLPDGVDTGDGSSISSSLVSSLGIGSSSTTTYALLAFVAVAAIVLLKKL